MSRNTNALQIKKSVPDTQTKLQKNLLAKHTPHQVEHEAFPEEGEAVPGGEGNLQVFRPNIGTLFCLSDLGYMGYLAHKNPPPRRTLQ